MRRSFLARRIACRSTRAEPHPSEPQYHRKTQRAKARKCIVPSKKSMGLCRTPRQSSDSVHGDFGKACAGSAFMGTLGVPRKRRQGASGTARTPRSKGRGHPLALALQSATSRPPNRPRGIPAAAVLARRDADAPPPHRSRHPSPADPRRLRCDSSHSRRASPAPRPRATAHPR